MKIYLVTVLSIFCLSSCVLATTFEEVNFENLVLNNHLMKNYDNKTGYFKNTSYEHQDVEKLKKEISDLEQKIKKLKNKEGLLASKSFAINEDEEDEIWENISDNYKNIVKIENEIIVKNESIQNNGEPDYTNLFFIMNQVASETILPLFDKKKIILNKLPNYYQDLPNISMDSYYMNFLNTLEEDSLKKYIDNTQSFTSIFPEFNNSILYNEYKDLEENEIGILDFSLAFQLHPKMALFNFMYIGFNKYEIGSSEEECDKKIDFLTNFAIDRNPDLKRLNDDLAKSDSLQYLYFNKISQGIPIENAKEKINKEKENSKKIHKAIFDVKYKMNYPFLTDPDETIKIFEEIYKDVTDSIQLVVNEKKLKLVLNSSLILDHEYEKKYKARSIMGMGHAGLNYILFYSFYNDNNLSNPLKKQEKLDYLSKRWCKLVDVSENNDYFLYLKPYPMVITGGKSILKDVVKKMYKKYNIKLNVYPVLDSVITKIEAYQNGFDY